MSRYEPVTTDVIDLGDKIISEHFNFLIPANILYVFDTKKKVKNGNIIIASIKKMNEEMQFLAMNNDNIIYDYIMFIDKNIWNEVDDRDKERILYHEFCHCDMNKEKYTLRGHEIEGFHDEINFNADDPEWAERVSLISEAVYEK